MENFPVWIRATHWINVLFIGLLIRAGIQILAAYPRLYLNDHCEPGSEWLKLTRRRIPTSSPWTALQQEESVPGWLAQPGGNNLGLGRHWHFFGAIFWMLNGITYVTLLFTTGQWRRLVPTTWNIFPDAWHTLITYLSLRTPPASDFDPFDPLQQVSYFAVIFLLAPLLILTAAAQSPAVGAWFPWYPRLFGGRQKARSLHFLGLVGFMAFIAVHVFLVAYTGLADNLGDIMLGQHATNRGLAVGLAGCVLGAIAAFYALTSWYSRRFPRSTQRTLGGVIRAPMRKLSLRARSRQQYTIDEISPYLIVNGEPPATEEFSNLQQGAFAGWRLEIQGLVARPLTLTMADIRALPAETQITKHHCIQGWSGVASWKGVNVRDLMSRCQPLPEARFVVFTSYQLDLAGRPFYETLDLRLVSRPQTIVAYEMNGAALTVAHGAPLRLRVETELGFKMVKWLRTIEFVEDFRQLGGGQGGSREDNMYYERFVSI